VVGGRECFCKKETSKKKTEHLKSVDVQGNRELFGGGKWFQVAVRKNFKLSAQILAILTKDEHRKLINEV